MSKLTDTQIAVLTSAAEHEAGIATRPDKLKAAAAAKVAANLITGQLVREVQAKAGWPIWRKEADGKLYSLKIMRAGKAALPAVKPVAGEEHLAQDIVSMSSTPAENAPRDKSKIGGVVAMLERSGGATTDELVAATGWLPHTLRAALTGLRKRGYDVERFRTDEAASAYRISAGAVAAAA